MPAPSTPGDPLQRFALAVHRVSGACALALFVASSAPATNLVRNPGFETASPCPKDYTQIQRADPWRSPTRATPDFFHTCGKAAEVRVPTCGFSGPAGCFPRSGSGIAGFEAGQPTTSLADGSFQEYLHQKLAAPLAGNTTYQVELYVILADRSISATHNLGVHFSGNRITEKKEGPLYRPFHVRNPATRLLDDTQNWTLISGRYEAVGGEEWITIGSFGVTPLVGQMPTGVGSAYYYVDDVSVCTPPATPSFSIASELCPADPLLMLDSGTADETDYLVEVYRTDALGSDVVLEWLGCQAWVSGAFPGSLDLASFCPSGAFDEPGVYRVKLAVQNACTTFEEQVEWFTLRSASCCAFSADITPPGPIDACGGVTLTSTTAAGTAPFAYEWYGLSDPPVAVIDPQPPAITLPAPIEGTFRVQITDALGCVAQSPAVDVTLGDGLARLAAPRIACAGEPLVVDASGSVADDYVLEIHETDAVGSSTVLGGAWTSSIFTGSPGEIDLSALYPFAFEVGKVYRIELSVNGCAVGGDAVRYVVADCCGDCTPPPPGMVAWWPAEGDAQDRTPFANHGVATGGVTYPAGRVGSAFSVPSAGVVSVADDPSLDFGTGASGDFSIDLWFQNGLTFGFGSDAPFVRKRAASGYEFGYENDPGAASPVLYLVLQDAGGSTRLEAPIAPTLAGWHHVGVTVDRDDTEGAAFFFDGAAVDRLDPTSRPGDLSNTADLEIVPDSGSLGVAVDEIEVFERALREQEIEDIYLADGAGKCTERCSLPPVLSFCGGQSQRTATLRVCNDTGSPHAFDVKFLALEGGDGDLGIGCNTDGPIGFSPAQVTTAPVPAGDCVDVPTAIDAPASFSIPTPSETGCYLAQVTNVDTGDCSSCAGTVRQASLDTLCPSSSGGFSNVLQGGTTPVGFELQNPGATPMSVDYSIRPIAADGDPTDPHLRLQGQARIDEVTGSVEIPPGGSSAVSTDVCMDAFQGFGVETVVLLSDVDGDGLREPVDGRRLEPIPMPEPSGRAARVVGGAAVLLLMRRRRAARAGRA